MSRALAVLAVVAVYLLPAVPAALAKEDVQARVYTPVPSEAVPGETITIAWTLTYAQGDGRRPFGAGGVFVRLLSASGGKPTKEHGSGPDGRYVADIKVPEGGIGGIQFGLEGTRYVGGPLGDGRAQDADVLFPLVNDPFKDSDVGAPRTSPPAGATDGGGELSIWLAFAGVLTAVPVIVALRRGVTSRRPARGM